MQTMQKLSLALVVTAATLAAQNPSITGIVNAASGRQSASQPLPTTAGLAGTSVTITVNGTTLTAPLYSTVSTQVAAVLPSNTPAGTGTLTLTYNGNKGS